MFNLEMILKMSLITICLGGIKAYFNPVTKIYLSCDQSIYLKTIEANEMDEQLTWKLNSDQSSATP